MENQHHSACRSLDLHRLIAERVRADPVLLERVKRTNERWHDTLDASLWEAIDVWQSMIAGGLETCLAMATEDSERADELRQVSPFTGILSPTDRLEFLKSWTPEGSKTVRDRWVASQSKEGSQSEGVAQPMVDSMTMAGELKRPLEGQEGAGEELAPDEGAEGQVEGAGRLVGSRRSIP